MIRWNLFSCPISNHSLFISFSFNNLSNTFILELNARAEIYVSSWVCFLLLDESYAPLMHLNSIQTLRVCSMVVTLKFFSYFIIGLTDSSLGGVLTSVESYLTLSPLKRAFEEGRCESTMFLYLLSTIFWYSTLAKKPLHMAWVRVISWASLSSLISSRSPRRPALKKTWTQTMVRMRNHA